MAKCKYYRPYFDTLSNLIGQYYQLEGCCTGGPLHILLDDDNYDTHSIDFCIDWCFKGLRKESEYYTDYSNEVYVLGIMICNEYARMPLEERAAFDSYLCGHNLECEHACHIATYADECPVLGELYDFMKEKEPKEINNG